MEKLERMMQFGSSMPVRKQRIIGASAALIFWGLFWGLGFTYVDFTPHYPKTNQYGKKHG